MSTKQLLRLVIILVVLLGVWGVMVLTRRPSHDRDVRLAFPSIDTATVDTVAITAHGDTALLVRAAGRQWMVNGYPAAKTNVRQMLYALRDTSNRLIVVAQSPAAEASLGVTADSGQRVRIVAGGRTVLDWTTGHQTDDYAGLYVRPTAGDAVYAMHGTLVGSFGHKLDEWRDRTIVALAREGVQRVDVEHGRDKYSVIRGPKAWMVGQATADSAVAARLVNQLNPLTAQAFATPAQAAAANFGHPTARVRVFGPTGALLADILFDSTKAGVWARADSGRTVYQVGDWVLATLAPTERTLRAGVPRAR
ncbi:MAG: DUF4340 domain-containing protein [Gemmatimonadaceae bacterium]|nr:DUF4340 domain-containing protein [Gemmatimonadaceae bacterium]